MKLYQNPMSPPCRRVLATMYQLNSPVELMNVEFQSAQMQSPEYLKMNPNGSVPTLSDGDFSLWESCAIMQYLCEKKGNTELYPNDAKARADINRWQFWGSYHFGPAAGTIVWENFVKPMMKMGECDAKELATATEDFHKFAKVLDGHLAGKEWVSGKTCTLADFSLGANLMYADAGHIPWGGYTNIKAWYKRLESTDGWKKSTPPKF